MTERIEQIRAEAQHGIDAAADTQALEEARIRYLGRKAELPNLLRNVAQLQPSERAATGKASNEARRVLEQAIERKGEELPARELEQKLPDQSATSGADREPHRHFARSCARAAQQ